jgi:hypothetical protein
MVLLPGPHFLNGAIDLSMVASTSGTRRIKDSTQSTCADAHQICDLLRCPGGVMPQVAAVIPGASRPSRIAEDSDALNEVAPAELVGMI